MYIEYHNLYKEYKQASRKYDEATEKGMKLTLAVLPKASQMKEVMVSGGNISSDLKLLEYASEIEKVDKLIKQTKNTRDSLENDLKERAIKLKEEGDIYDKIYYYKWIEHKSVYKFNRLVGYSVRQVYNYIGEMKEKLYPKIEKKEKDEENDKIAQNCTKLGL